MIYRTGTGTVIDEGTPEATEAAVDILVNAGVVVRAEIEPGDTVLAPDPVNPILDKYTQGEDD